MGQHRTILRAMLLVPLLLPGLSDQGNACDAPTAGPAEGRPESRELVYQTDSPAGNARLVVRPALNSLLFRVDRADGGPSDLATQAALLQPLLTCFVRDHDQLPRLFVVFRDSSALFDRLQRAAAASPDWGRSGGLPTEGDAMGASIAALVNTGHLAREPEEVFASLGYDLRATGAEQIMVGRKGTGGIPIPVSGVIGFEARRRNAR